MESFSYYSLPLPPLPPSREEKGSFGADAVGAQRKLQMQVPECHTTSDVDGGASCQILATSDAAEVTKSPPMPPSREEKGSFDTDVVGPQQELQMQVPECHTTSDVDGGASGQILATSDAAEVTKSGDVDTDDNDSVVEIIDVDSHYQSSEDEDDAGRKNNAVNLDEGAAAVKCKLGLTHFLLP